MAARELTPSARRLPRGIDEARRQVTVLFCDLVGSTELSGKLDPEDLRDVLERYQHRVASLVEKFDGRLHHTLGDGVMASWGYPRAREGDTIRAVLAGLAVVDAVADIAHVLPSMPALAARVGIHTGIALIVDTELGSRQERGNLIGETPNLAARLQAVAEPGRVVISEATYDLVRGRFSVADLGTPAMKGVSRDIRVFRVVRPAEPISASARSELDRPFVGRHEEVQVLEAAWEKARRGAAPVVLLAGDAGIGKSRLVQYLSGLVRSVGRPAAVVHCSPLLSGTAFGAMRQFLMQAAGITVGDPLSARRERLIAFCAHRPGLQDGESIAILAALLSIAPGDGVAALKLSPDQRRERTLAALLAVLDSVAVDGAGLIAFDDLHWTDPSTAELGRRLVERGPAPGTLVVLASRSTPAFGATDGQAIRLGPLRRSEAMLLTDQVAPELSASLRAAVVDRSDGVPLFVIELARSLARTSAGTATDIPPRLHDVLVARLDEYPEQRSLAQTMAVIGVAAARSLVEGVAELSADEARRDLGVLVEAGILADEGPVHDPVYRFHHALLRDAAYSTLLRSHRRSIHWSVALRLLEDDRSAATAPDVVAYHLEQAGKVAESLPWWRRAAVAAAGVAAHHEVVEHLRHVLELLPAGGAVQDVDEVEILVMLGASLVVLEGYTSREVSRINERAQQLFAASEDVTLGSGSFYPLWAYHHVRGELGASSALSRQMHERRGDSIAAAMVGYDRFEQGDLTASIAFLKRAQRLEREAASRAPQAASVKLIGAMPLEVWSASTVLLGAVQWIAGHRRAGRATMRKVIRHAQTLGLPNGPLTRAYVDCYAAWWSLLADDPMTAASYARRAVEVSAANGYTTWLAASSMHAAGAMARLGEPEKAAHTLEQLLQLWRENGAEVFRPVFLRWLGRAYASCGEIAAALRVLEEGVEHVRAFGGRVHEPELHRDCGLLLRDAGDTVAAVIALRAAAHSAEQQGAWSFAMLALTDLAQLTPASEASEVRAALRKVLPRISDRKTDPGLLRAESICSTSTSLRRPGGV
jgi:class 3 adenylate cyclase/tetratricopeptide (TPR) repeat protein